MLLSTVAYGIVAQQENAAAGGLFGALIGLAFALLMLAASWKIFTKAGQPGWATIVPIYNALVMLRICGRPGWWLLLLLIPFVNFVVGIIVCLDLAKSFGKGAGFGLGLLFLGPIFVLILGFGSAKYVGPAARQTVLAPAMV